MADHILQIIRSLPGIQRDGTQYNSSNYIDGQWCRFYEKGEPRKIGGYTLIDTGTTEIIRNMYDVNRQNTVDIYLGRPSTLSVLNITLNGQASPEIDRTPSSFVADPNNLWTFDLYTDLSGPTTYIIANASPNAFDINNNIETNIYWGDITLTTALTEIDSVNLPTTSGGIIVVYPYVFIYGSDGVVGYTLTPTNWSAATYVSISGTKIIKGLRTRGGSNAPACLFWSLNSLVRATFVGGTAVFQFDVIQDNVSILSQNCIVTIDNIYFWIGIDRFYIYNGVVQSLNNEMSKDWFFNNINLSYRQKVWGMGIERYNEIWWFYPKGNATECTDCIIYNYKLNTWYDSSIARTAGVEANFYYYPLMADSNTIFDKSTGNGEKYGVWQHETGKDMVLFGQSLAIDSYYDTHIISYFDQNPQNDRQMRTRRIEPDFVQSQSMTVIVKSRDFAQSTVVESNPYPFLPGQESIILSKIDMTQMGRLINFRFQSNISGGDYQMGKTLLNYAPGDVYP